MASLIKNRILKHLSKFTKNLSSDKINVSTLKGEGELTNLELNEEVLTDLLELPVWIRLTKAVCNKVSCKIIWTKLKSVPIFLNLDEVLVEMETCEKLRQHNTQTTPSNYSSGSKYGFADKVIDGMTVRINSVVINFKSTAFHASLQLSRLCLDSRTPLWQHSDLRMTRLKEPEHGQLLIFKQLEWQTLRVEATADQLEGQQYTPLRLITNQARCRITIKKKLVDCSVVGSRLVIILDELLWVLTDSQLKAASHLVNSLTHLIQRATELSHKTKAARKLESSPDWQNQQVPSTQSTSSSRGGVTPVDSVLARVFSTYDVHETSYHFCSGQIDLHLCDEVTPEGLSSTHPLLTEGGAMQISLHNLSCDYYPYHVAGGSRKFWLRYKDNATSRGSWVSSLLADFRLRLMEILPGESPKIHTPVHRASAHVDLNKKGLTPTKATISSYLSRLMSVCVVLRVDDFSIFCVSTPRSRTGVPTKWLTSDKSRLLLPQDMASVQMEFTQYYYPGDNNLPVPPHNMFIQINPIQVTFDPLTILWLNAFLLSLQKSQPSSPSTSSPPKVDVRLEALMPRFVIPESKEHSTTPERPKKLQIQISRLTITNSRIGDCCSRMELGKCLESLQQGELFFGSGFPSTNDDPLPVIDAFVHHALSSDRTLATNDETSQNTPSEKSDGMSELFDRMQKDLLRQEEKKIWCVHMDPIWADMMGACANKMAKPRPIPLLDAFPLTLWVHQKESNGDFHVLGHVQSLVNIQLGHFEYLFILRAMESISQVTKQLVTDTCHVTGLEVENAPTTCIAMLLPEVDLSLVMPVFSPVIDHDGDGISLNCESVTPDEGHFRSMKESTSEHLNLKTERETMTKSCSDSLLESRSPLQNGTPTNGSASSKERIDKSEISGVNPNPRERATSSDWSDSVPDNLQRTLASGSSVVKKGLTNLMSSIDSAFISNKVSSLATLDRKWGNSPDDGHSMEDWDTLSIRSDLSSDSDQFMMVHLDNQTSKLEDALFGSTTVAPKVERATEMKEDTPTTTSSSSSSVKRLDLVATCTLRSGKVQVIQHSRGYDSVMRVLTCQMIADENGNMSWDEFQTKFSARSRAWKEAFTGLNFCPCDVRIRYELGPAAETICPSAGERGVATIVARDVNLSFLMSNIIGLPDLIEDEIIPLPVPLRIYLENLNIHLQDDRPPMNVTSPGPIPVDLNISKMSIIREEDGVFQIKSGDTATNTILLPPLIRESTLPSKIPIKITSEASTVTESLLSEVEEENQQLRMKLMVLDTLQKENEDLKEMIEVEKVKAQSALQRVNEMEEEVAHLEEEKRSLLATRQVMQQELMALETRSNTYSLTHNATG